MAQKQFNTQLNIGKVKYAISYHDGVMAHSDGSAFWGIYTFSNKKDFENKIKQLKQQGYYEN